jgi:hypothetical protein
MLPKKQHAQYAKIESLWEREARNDYRYDMNQYKNQLAKGNRILAAMSKEEAGKSLYWANKRRNIVKRERRLAK